MFEENKCKSFAKQQIKISTHSSMTQNYDVCLMMPDILIHTDGFNCFDLYILFTKHEEQVFDIHPY